MRWCDLTCFTPFGKVGTARYFSPELGKDSKGTPPANDVWALGCIFLEMVSTLGRAT